MLVPSTEEVAYGGVVWEVRGDVQTRHVLESECWHSYWVDRDIDQSDPMAIPDIGDIAQWCAAYVRPLSDDIEWGGQSARRQGEIIDRELAVRDVLELKSDIIDACTFPEETIEALRSFWKVQFQGGCECMVCQGKVSKEQAADHVLDSCMMPNDVEQYVYHMASMYGGLDNVSLMDEPYWIYQIHRAHTIAKNEAMEEQKEEQEQTEVAHDKLRQHGIGEIQ